MLQKMLSDYAGGGAATSGDADPALPAGGVAPAEATGQPAPEDANLVDFAAWRRKRQEGGAG